MRGGTLQGSQPTQPALKTRSRGSHWRLEDTTIRGASTASFKGEVVRLGSSTQTIHDVPRNIQLERVTITGTEFGAHRGISLNSADTTITNCTVKEIFAPGLETQAICAWNTPGGLKIEGNDLQGGSIGVLIGGTAPSIPGLVPNGIEFRYNHVHRPVVWRPFNYACKNLFELKSGRNVVVEHNTFENNWFQSQAGYAIVFTPRATTAPWTTISNVTFRRNLVQHSGAGINTLGTDTNNPSGPLEGLVIEDNTFLDINGQTWGGTGTFLQLVNEPHGLTVVRNVVLNTGHGIFIDSSAAPGVREPVQNLHFEDNVLRSGTIRGNGTPNANLTIATYLPGSTIVGNDLGGENPLSAPIGNLYPTRAEIDARYGQAA